MNKDLFILLVAALMMPTQADAYVDPGSASLVIQATIAAFAGLAIALRRFRALIGKGIHWVVAQFTAHES